MRVYTVFEIFTVVKSYTLMVLKVMIPYRLASGRQQFRGTYHLHLFFCGSFYDTQYLDHITSKGRMKDELGFGIEVLLLHLPGGTGKTMKNRVTCVLAKS
jgi:hypothetical protein